MKFAEWQNLNAAQKRTAFEAYKKEWLATRNS